LDDERAEGIRRCGRGGGSFGAWTAWHLAKRGKKVVLVDAYGPRTAARQLRGESRIIRMGYGTDELYTLWSQNSLVQWKKFFAATQPPLFHETGVLWLEAAMTRS